MPRLARVKEESAIYHVMVRSISEIELFNESEDKKKYFQLIKKYQLKYQFKIYAYCLLDNHGHLLIDANGGDISRIMHGINFSYAQYFNRKYKRHGHVFQDRFKSKIIDTDKYLSMVSAYIHQNAVDVVNNKKQVLKYEFSSLREYVKNTDTYGILNKEFLKEVIGLRKKRGINSHLSKIFHEESIKNLDGEFEEEGCEYRSYRKILTRNHKARDVIKYICQYTNTKDKHIHVKYKKKYTHIRALGCFFMSCFCNINQKDICEVIGNITQSRVSELSNMGVELAFNNSRYKGVVDGFLLQA